MQRQQSCNPSTGTHPSAITQHTKLTLLFPAEIIYGLHFYVTVFMACDHQEQLTCLPGMGCAAKQLVATPLSARGKSSTVVQPYRLRLRRKDCCEQMESDCIILIR